MNPMKDGLAASALLACTGILMADSGILIAVCASPLYGGVLWAAAACMIVAARHFWLAEKKTNETEESDNESATV